ncbi:hypothetical protein D3C81_1023990 [compost metagenome]
MGHGLRTGLVVDGHPAGDPDPGVVSPSCTADGNRWLCAVQRVDNVVVVQRPYPGAALFYRCRGRPGLGADRRACPAHGAGGLAGAGDGSGHAGAAASLVPRLAHSYLAWGIAGVACHLCRGHPGGAVAGGVGVARGAGLSGAGGGQTPRGVASVAYTRRGAGAAGDHELDPRPQHSLYLHRAAAGGGGDGS